jgi:hypothetical protein
MNDSFRWGRLRFQVEGNVGESELNRYFRADLDDDLGLLLTRSGKLPELGGAPLASWLLARLARLTNDSLGLAGEEHNDGGGYVIEFVVYRVHAEPENNNAPFVQLLLFDPGECIEPDLPVASFQFQADMEGAVVLGQRDPDFPAGQILEAFAAALLAAPTELTARELAVRDPEWQLDPEIYTPWPEEDSRNWYGWNGFRFLGKDNIREQDSHRLGG